MATVTISVPEAWMDSTISSGVLYLPVPKMSRELNTFPAITNWPSMMDSFRTPGTKKNRQG